MINGTVIGPVVTRRIKRDGQKTSRDEKCQNENNAVKYNQQMDRGKWKSIRSTAMTRKTPTPKCHGQNQCIIRIEGTCSTSTRRSGSDIVIMKPSRKTEGRDDCQLSGFSHPRTHFFTHRRGHSDFGHQR